MDADKTGRNGEDAGILERLDSTPETQSAARTRVILLPGLGEDDPELDAFLELTEQGLDLIRISYLDWAELAKPESDFTTLISHVKRQIENKAPSGPLRMAGYSIGGHLAYACATAFQAEGRPVMCIAILDAPANVEDFVPPLGERLRQRVGKLLEFDFRAGLASLLAKGVTRDVQLSLLRRLSRFRDRPLPLHFERYLHTKVTMQLLMRMFPPWWHTMSNPVPLLGAPTFIFRSEEHQTFERTDLGWGEYCSNVEVISVVGSHRTMLDPENCGPMCAELMKIMSPTKA